MSDADVTSTAAADWPPVSPWHLLIGAGAAAALVFPLRFLPTAFPSAFMTLGALMTAGAAVTLRPRSARLVALAGLVAVVTWAGMDPAWDSARLAVSVLAGVALAAAGLLALPWLFGWLYATVGGRKPSDARERGQWAGRIAARGIVSLLVLAHFVGIASAFLSVPPSGDREPAWMAQRGWSALQPYLQFVYLVNAYRFYSPEPGPPSMLWFHLEYADGSTRSVKVPNRAEDRLDPLNQEYTRRLSIGESVNQLAPIMDIPDHVKRNRIAAGNPAFNRHLERPIPLHPDLMMSINAQYRVPMDHAKRLLCEYARFAAEKYPSEKDPGSPVTSVKIYRVVHRMLDPREMANPDVSPTDPWTYWPYFQGEFVKPKEATDPLTPWVLKDPYDPFLYWLIPIYQSRQPVIDPRNPDQPAANPEYRPVLEDCLQTHERLKMKPGQFNPPEMGGN